MPQPAIVLVVLASGAVAGLVLGLFGAGGTIVALPLLLDVAGMAPHEAIGTNALGVAATALALLAWRGWLGEIRFREGLAFAIPGLVGILIGSEIGLAFPGGRLVFLLGFVVFGVAGWMAYLAWRLGSPAVARAAAELDPETGAATVPDPLTGPTPSPHPETGLATAPAPVARSPRRLAPRIGGVALGVGGLAGLFGVGGGFLVVPGLAWAGDLDLREAARAGLVAIAAFAALIGVDYLAAGSASPTRATVMFAGGLAGGALGVWLSRRVPRRAFQFAFAGFLVLIGALMVVH